MKRHVHYNTVKTCLLYSRESFPEEFIAERLMADGESFSVFRLTHLLYLLLLLLLGSEISYDV
jgi:hypothetical protein